MSRGPTIQESEIREAHRLKAEGKKLKVICAELKRTEPTVRKMLRTELPKEEISQ